MKSKSPSDTASSFPTEDKSGTDTTTGMKGKGESIFQTPYSVRGKLIVTLLIVSALGSVAVLTAGYAMWRIEDKIGIIESFYELNQEVLEIRRYEKNYFLYNNKKDLMSALDYIDQVRATIIAVRHVRPEDEKRLMDFSVNELSRYESVFRRLIEDDLSIQERKDLQDALRNYGQEITRHIFAMDTDARVHVEREVSGYQQTAVVTLGLALLIGGISMFYLLRWIVRPLKAIREASARIMQGKMNTIPINESVRGSVEGTELVNSLNLMLMALKAKQDQLVQSEKLAAIGKVTAGIAHEINNPLNNISLTAEALIEDLPNLDACDALDLAHDILVQSERASEVVHHLLQFSRASKSTTQDCVNIVTLVDESIALLRNQFRLGQKTYHYDHPDIKICVKGNPHQLQQLIVNMMLNGIQAMQPGGNIDLAVKCDERYATISITDQGMGMAPDVLDHIFDPFFTTKNDGTGLGLSLSHSIIEEHKGKIEVQSEQGKGTTFIINLPLAQAEQL